MSKIRQICTSKEKCFKTFTNFWSFVILREIRILTFLLEICQIDIALLSKNWSWIWRVVKVTYLDNLDVRIVPNWHDQCQQVPTVTNRYQQMPTDANRCPHIPTYAHTCLHMPTSTYTLDLGLILTRNDKNYHLDKCWYHLNTRLSILTKPILTFFTKWKSGTNTLDLRSVGPMLARKAKKAWPW